jgi:hypothetical protein
VSPALDATPEICALAYNFKWSEPAINYDLVQIAAALTSNSPPDQVQPQPACSNSRAGPGTKGMMLSPARVSQYRAQASIKSRRFWTMSPRR